MRRQHQVVAQSVPPSALSVTETGQFQYPDYDAVELAPNCEKPGEHYGAAPHAADQIQTRCCCRSCTVAENRGAASAFLAACSVEACYKQTRRSASGEGARTLLATRIGADLSGDPVALHCRKSLAAAGQTAQIGRPGLNTFQGRAR
jgi:hypothetical protein